MMRRLRDSGIKWIGEIPENWRIESIGRHFENRNEKVSDYDYAPLSVTKSGVVPQLDEVAKSNAHEDRKLVRRGDFVINSRSDRKQSCGLSSYDGSVSLINLVLVPHGEIDSLYSSYLFNNYGFAEEFYRWGTGIVADLWSTKWDLMRRINVPVPPIAEQKKIADFLDGKCAEIDELVQTEEKMIEELKAYKQSVITEAVTKGLDPSAPMKDSGIEWIGKIPECWEIMTLKSLFDFGKGLPITKEDLRVSGEKVISYGQIHAKFNISTRIVNDMYRFVDSVYVDSHSNSIVKVGDFIFADTSEDLSGVGDFVYINDNDVIFAGYHSIILKSRMTTSNKYLAYLFLSDCWRSQLRSRVSGIKVFSISKNILSRVTVLFPSASEQQKIADYLDDKCAKIDEMIAIRNEQIDQLKEYKKSLIYEYVTGKKEVV